MNDTLTKTEKRVARPLKVLVPLIKHDIADMRNAAKEASAPYQIAAGEKLIEAKAQLGHGQFRTWVKQNFNIGDTAASEWMRMARAQNDATASFSSSHEFRMKTNPRYAETHDQRFKIPPDWQAPVKERLERLDTERFNVRRREISEAKERAAQRLLALNLIDIGYKILSVKLHPDKGGSPDAMRRLNAVRSWLKQAAQER